MWNMNSARYVCVYVCTYMCIWNVARCRAAMYICMHTCMYACMYACMFKAVPCTWHSHYAYIDRCIHTYIHSHTHKRSIFYLRSCTTTYIHTCLDYVRAYTQAIHFLPQIIHYYIHRATVHAELGQLAWVYMCVCVCVCIYKYIHMYMYIYVYIKHSCMHVPLYIQN